MESLRGPLFFSRHHDFPSSFWQKTPRLVPATSTSYALGWRFSTTTPPTLRRSFEWTWNMRGKYDAHRNHQNLPQCFGKSYPMVFLPLFPPLPRGFFWKSWRVGHFLMSHPEVLPVIPAVASAQCIYSWRPFYSGRRSVCWAWDQKIWGALCS